MRAAAAVLRGWLAVDGIAALVALVLFGGASALLIAWMETRYLVGSFVVFALAVAGLGLLAKLAAPVPIGVWRGRLG